MEKDLSQRVTKMNFKGVLEALRRSPIGVFIGRYPGLRFGVMDFGGVIRLRNGGVVETALDKEAPPPGAKAIVYTEGESSENS